MTIRNFTIPGPPGGDCEPGRRGFGVDGGGSVTLEGNNVRAASGC